MEISYRKARRLSPLMLLSAGLAEVGLQAEHSPLDRGGNGGGAVVHAKLGEDVEQVGLHRIAGHASPDLLVRGSPRPSC